ncbi:MAG: toxin-antitoxin system HicB family antitoxin, partial [Pseudomonadota bacterium]
VHAAIERLAGAELRSANAQIEVLLREALKARGIEAERSAKPRRGRPPKET